MFSAEFRRYITTTTDESQISFPFVMQAQKQLSISSQEDDEDID
jgi:hypothetical protein